MVLIDFYFLLLSVDAELNQKQVLFYQFNLIPLS